ncbi:MAG: hypothetical protein ACHQLQ_03035 [Candidatus Acidiferrales bacterium]
MLANARRRAVVLYFSSPRASTLASPSSLRTSLDMAIACSKLHLVMICPQCKAEYRPGFTVCADCEVPLVAQLSTPSSGPADSTEPGEDPFCSFWKGDDPRIHAELCELLDEQGIPHKTLRREDHLFNLNSKNAFQIGIPFSFFEKAEAAIKEAYGDDEGTPTVPVLLPDGSEHVIEAGILSGLFEFAKGYAKEVQGSTASTTSLQIESLEENSSLKDDGDSRSDWNPTLWYAEDATVEVWRGDQPELGEMIAASLQENQIHSRPGDSAGNCALFVMPGDEPRAREIVREIVEGAPPE